MLNCTQAEKCTSARTASSQGGEIGADFQNHTAGRLSVLEHSRSWVYAFGHTKPVEPAIDQDLRYCDGWLILGWHSLRVLRENIRHDKHIISPVSSRFKQLFLPQDERLWRGHSAESSDSGSLYQLLSLANNNAAWLGKSFVPAPGAHGCH